jgi:hypothetical protein
MGALVLASSTTDWLAALGAVGAVILGAFGLVPQWRERRSKAIRDRQSQAVLVTAWAEPRRTANEPRVIVARNASDEPVYDVQVWLVTSPMTPSDLQGREVSAKRTLLKAHDDLTHAIATNRPPPNVPPRVILTFRDARKQSWWRDFDGVLHQLEDR